MKLIAVAAFGAGYLLGTRAGRERYEYLRGLAHGAGDTFAASGARRRLEEYGARLEAYAAQSRLGQASAGQSRPVQSHRGQAHGSQSRGGQARGQSRRSAGAGSGGQTRS